MAVRANVAVASALLLLLLHCAGCDGSSGHEPEQVHLSLTKNSELLVMWVTKEPTSSSVVQFGAVGPDGHVSKTFLAEGIQYDYELEEYKSGSIHAVVLPTLEPNTRYAYAVGSDGMWSRTFYFVSEGTGTTESSHLRIAFLSDSSTAKGSEFVMLAMKALHEEVVTGEKEQKALNLILHGGDLSYADKDEAKWDTYGRMWEPLLSSAPLMTALGNHEAVDRTMSGYLNRYLMPDMTDRGFGAQLFYSFDYGLAHVIVLDSEHRDKKFQGVQYKWLKKHLRTIDRKKTPWVIGMWHSPWYHTNSVHKSSGKKMRDEYGYEALLKGHLDISLAGHVHAYERTHPVFAGEVDHSWGTIHVTCGIAGSAESMYARWEERAEWSAHRSVPGFGFGVMDIYNHTHMRWQLHSIGRSTSDDTILWPTDIEDEVWVVKEDSAPGAEKTTKVTTPVLHVEEDVDFSLLYSIVLPIIGMLVVLFVVTTYCARPQKAAGKRV